MKKKYIYIFSAIYCIVASIIVVGELILHNWWEAVLLFLLYFFIALADYYRYQAKKIAIDSLIQIQRAENAVITIGDMAERLLIERTKNKQKKLLMFNCDHCPRKSDTCQKLVYEDRTECVEPVEHFDL